MSWTQLRISLPLSSLTPFEFSLFSDAAFNKKVNNNNNDNGSSFPTLLAFAGVFDGHDGPKAAEYCSKGLLAHILYEQSSAASSSQNKNHHLGMKRRFPPTTPPTATTTTIASTNVRASTEEDLLENTYVRAFHRAHERFGAGMEPPTTNNSTTTSSMSLGKQSSWRNLLKRRRANHHTQVIGGTTACTLSLVSCDRLMKLNLIWCISNILFLTLFLSCRSPSTKHNKATCWR